MGILIAVQMLPHSCKQMRGCFANINGSFVYIGESQENLYTTHERSDLCTRSSTVSKFLILKEEKASLMLRLLHYFLARMCTLLWVNVECLRTLNKE